MSNQFSTRRIKPMRTKDDLNKRELLNTSGATIAKHSILRVVSTKSDGAYHQCAKAIADGTQPVMPLFVGWHDVQDDVLVIASEHYLLEMDTSTASLGDLVYLSDTVAGAVTLTATSEPVGWVNHVGSAGLVWIDPQGAAASTAAVSLEGYRPDVDLAWEARIAAGDGDVHVDGAVGNDTSGDGTPAKPYLTIGAAIMDIPHNRTATALRAVTVVLDQPGLGYAIPSHIEATSLITIKGTLPAASYTGDVTVVNTTTTAAGMWLDTDIAFASEKLTGCLVKYPSGKYGQVAATYDDGGGFCSIFATQAVNGSAYDTSLVTDTLEFWLPTDMCTVISANTGGNGTNFSQMDSFKINFCRLSSTGGSGKLVFYQSRATLQNCNIEDDIGRIYVNNGSLSLDNCYVAAEGESKEFAMASAGAHAVLQLRGGTVFNGTNAGANNYPVSATGNARVLTSGPILYRLCKGLSLSNGAQIGYADGYLSDVSWYFTDHSANAPIVSVDLRADGVPVVGTVPDIHGDALGFYDYLIQADAPCQLWLGQGTDIPHTRTLTETATPVSLNGGVSELAGNEYDGSFVRLNRARANINLGVGWGPYKAEPAIAAGKPNTDVVLDWINGTSQLFDFSDAGNDAGGGVDWYFRNPTVGAWHTLELIQADTLPHDFTNVPITWSAGAVPNLSQDSGGVDVLRFFYTGSGWFGEHVKAQQSNVVKQRVQLADLPAATDTGLTGFGNTLAANTVITGMALYLHADPTVGASGITGIYVSSGFGNVGLSAGTTLITTLDLFGETGSPKYLDSSTNAADFAAGSVFTRHDTMQPFYQIAATGANLDQLTAFDITLFLFVSSTVLEVP